jgi:hypothetical protein
MGVGIIYEEGLPNIWGNAQIFSHIWDLLWWIEFTGLHFYRDFLIYEENYVLFSISAHPIPSSFNYVWAWGQLSIVDWREDNRNKKMPENFDDDDWHKVLTYVEYRAVSGVLQNIDLPSPLHPASVSSPAPKGVHTRRAVRGWGVNILEDARHWIGLLQYNPSTMIDIECPLS